MRPGWAALPALLALTACSPVAQVPAAARSLRFAVDRVEPRFNLAFPLERSRVAFRIVFTVDNPSDVTFHLRGFEGELGLEAEGIAADLGHLALVQPTDLAARGRAALVLEVSFGYQDLRANWDTLQAALIPGAVGAWTLTGTLKAEAYGITWPLPVKAREPLGGRP